MNKREREQYRDEAIHDAAYEAVKCSHLWDSLPSNDAIDNKATELAVEIKKTVEAWLEREEVEIPELQEVG